MTDPLVAVREALPGVRAWVVGGALRDRLLGHPTEDLDLVVDADVGATARRLARGLGGPVFGLSEQFGAWRVLAPDRSWHVDLSPLAGETIEADLMARDLTVNALADPLHGGERLDPSGGLADLAARRLRLVSDDAIDRDPLRALRLVRLACRLDFAVEPVAAAAARAAAPGLERVSPERIFAELRLILTGPRAVAGMRLAHELGLTAVVLPELTALRGVQQSRYHHLDVYEHTLAVLGTLIDLEADLGPTLGELAEPSAAVLSEPLADELTRGEALRFGALLHDAAKPATREVAADGHVTFIGHDEQGAALARDVLGRLRASERMRAYVTAVTRHHLRLGFLVHERPLSRRAVHAYVRATDPVGVDVTVLSVADRLATRGRNADEAIAAHVELARELLGEALAWRADGPPAPLIRGDELAREIGLAPGPELGRLLDELEAARFAGEVASREQAVEHARAALGRLERGG